MALQRDVQPTAETADPADAAGSQARARSAQPEADRAPGRTPFRCRSPRCGCRPRRPARRPRRTVRPRDWPGRVMWQVDARPLTVAALAERLAGARRDPAFQEALSDLRRAGLLGYAPLVPGQLARRLERKWP